MPLPRWVHYSFQTFSAFNPPEHYENMVVEKYCIMLDHVHLILRIESDIYGRMISAPTIVI